MSVLEIKDNKPDEFDNEEEDEEDTDVDQWRMNIHQYHRAAKLGWFQNPHVELLDGSVHYKYTGEEFAWPNQPSEFAYQTLTGYSEADSVAPLALPQTFISVANLFPPLPEQEDGR